MWRESWLPCLSASNSFVLPLSAAISVTCVHINTCYKAAVWLSPELEDTFQNLHVLLCSPGSVCSTVLRLLPVETGSGRVGGTEPGVTETGFALSTRMKFSYAFRWWNTAILESVSIVSHFPAHILLSGFDRWLLHSPYKTQGKQYIKEMVTFYVTLK